jgi:hypothetical protein
MTIACVACETPLSPDYPLLTLVQDVNELLFYIAPIVLFIVLWKSLVTNRTTPRGDVTVLGLDASTRTYSPSRNER